jgi:hypothetical protein
MGICWTDKGNCHSSAFHTAEMQRLPALNTVANFLIKDRARSSRVRQFATQEAMHYHKTGFSHTHARVDTVQGSWTEQQQDGRGGSTPGCRVLWLYASPTVGKGQRRNSQEAC